ncbi:MAG TPA: glycosyl hydrolase [Gemmatimonadales bacterium]
MRRFVFVSVLASLLPAAVAPSVVAQGYDSTLFNALEWRMIGPFRGGRSAAVAGHAAQPYTYYFGGTGGGVWKTTDGGMAWEPVTDGTDMAGSIGAIAVAPSDPNVVYVGTGESPPRGNVSPGNGMYRSTDGGATWAPIGLASAGQIGGIVVHPTDHELLYVAALGHIFGPNPERGVFRSRDGGATWEKILYRNEDAGAIDLVMDPTNPRIIYAALWQVRRYPWTMESGGPGSGLFKTTDGGDSWTEITRHEGMPEGTIGKIGVTVSPVNPNRVWAIVEADEGGVFRSDDGGRRWTRVNDERRLRQRAWYYTHIHADPKDVETVYVMNTGFYRSVDGGATYSAIRVPHGDNHALWIAPNDAARMINGNDGGANVSYNGGVTWTRQDNQPTAQMYHAFATSDVPYKVCGGQQDNSTICVPSRTTGFAIQPLDYDYGVGGCESGYVTQRPDNPNIYFAGCYGGQLDRHDLSTGQERSVSVWPDNPMGWGAADLRERFQWTYPIIVSPHAPSTLFVTSQHVHRTTDEGQSWERISPDLTRNDTSKMGPSGGPITKDNTSVEYYGTVFTLTPSPHEADVIWAGSDDGLVHVTRDGGRRWNNVTPNNLPEWALISIIDVSPHDPATAYVAATRYKLDDVTPYIYKTTNYGQSWRLITRGIPRGHFIRTVREDLGRPGLLYAGGEFGVYVSFNGGDDWQSLQLNLPVVPIHDLILKDTDVIVATHGRSFWIMDDITPLRSLNAQVAAADAHLFTPRPTPRMGGGGGFGGGATGVGRNPPAGVMTFFYLRAADEDAEVTLDFLEQDGDLIQSYSTTARDRGSRLEVAPGMNRFVWNLRYPDASRFPGLIMWGGSTAGPRAVPGTYQVRLTVGAWSSTQPIALLPDPRLRVSQTDLKEQFDFLIRIRDRVSEANDAVSRIRTVRGQVDGVVERVNTAGDAIDRAAVDSVKQLASALNEAMREIEEAVYQTRNRSNQDPLNFPIRLNNKIAALTGVVSSGDFRPTDQAYAVFEELSAQLQVQLDRLSALLTERVPQFNTLVGGLNLPAIVIKGASTTS